MSHAAEPKKRPLFFGWLFELDRILRGEATRPSDIQKGDFRIPIVGISVMIIALAVTYGLCMGVFAMARGWENSQYEQALLQTTASMVKVPLLFILTLVVTFPSLYVFNALVGSRLTVLPVLKLLLAALAVMLAVLASLGPILAFFSVSTPNYAFIVLLNVAVFAAAGLLGMTFLLQTLNRLTVSRAVQVPIAKVRSLEADQQTSETSQDVEPAEDEPVIATGPLDKPEGIVLDRHVRKVFACWIVLFGLVGSQMGWVLRPFIGAPGRPFEWLRTRESNFFEAVWNCLQSFLGG